MPLGKPMTRAHLIPEISWIRLWEVQTFWKQEKESRYVEMRKDGQHTLVLGTV